MGLALLHALGAPFFSHCLSRVHCATQQVHDVSSATDLFNGATRTILQACAGLCCETTGCAAFVFTAQQTSSSGNNSGGTRRRPRAAAGSSRRSTPGPPERNKCGLHLGPRCSTGLASYFCHRASGFGFWLSPRRSCSCALQVLSVVFVFGLSGKIAAALAFMPYGVVVVRVRVRSQR